MLHVPVPIGPCYSRPPLHPRRHRACRRQSSRPRETVSFQYFSRSGGYSKATYASDIPLNEGDSIGLGNDGTQNARSEEERRKEEFGSHVE